MLQISSEKRVRKSHVSLIFNFNIYANNGGVYLIFVVVFIFIVHNS